MELSGAVLPNGFAHTSKMFDFRCGSKPRGGNMKNAGSRFAYILLYAFLIATGVASSAQTFTRLAKFNGTNGEWPLYGSLIQGTDGNCCATANRRFQQTA